MLCVLAGCLFPGEGQDGVLRITFGMPGLELKPGTPVSTGPALSKARVLSGEQVMRRAFELDAARADAGLGTGATWHRMETTSCDGTTAELFSNDVLADAFGVPEGGTKPKVRIVADVRTGPGSPGLTVTCQHGREEGQHGRARRCHTGEARRAPRS